MIKLEDIEIRSVNYKTLDNGACGVEVEWTTPEILPNIRFGYYSLSYQKYREYCEKDSLWDWCRNVVFQNELLAIDNYDSLINDPATKVYLFHGTNTKMLDDFLVRGTFFTTDLTIAMKYGKTIYAFELNNRSFKYFKLNKEGYFQSLGHIPLSHCIKLEIISK